MTEAKYKIGDKVWTLNDRFRPEVFFIHQMKIDKWACVCGLLSSEVMSDGYRLIERKQDICHPTLEALLESLKQNAIPFKGE